jgi:hypothetical protein
MFRSGAQLMILVLLVGLFLMRESRQAPADALEEGFADFLAMNSQRKEAPAPVTLVEINESSLRGHAWPWTPLDLRSSSRRAAPFSRAPGDGRSAAVGSAKFNRDQQLKLPQYQKDPARTRAPCAAPAPRRAARLPRRSTQLPAARREPIIRRVAVM